MSDASGYSWSRVATDLAMVALVTGLCIVFAPFVLCLVAGFILVAVLGAMFGALG